MSPPLPIRSCRDGMTHIEPTIRALRQHAESVRTAELQRLARRLSGLDPAEREVIETLTRGIIDELLHAPITRLRQAATQARAEHLACAVRRLFDLDSDATVATGREPTN